MKKIKIVLIILFITIGYFTVNYLIAPYNDASLVNNLENVDYSNEEISRIISLSENSTIINALIELKAGFIHLEKQSKRFNYNSSIIQRYYENNFNSKSSLNEDKYCPYVLAIYKYHMFFKTYAEKLHLNNIYLVDIKNYQIIYSVQLDHNLLNRHPDNEFNKLVNTASNIKESGQAVFGLLSDNKTYIYCSPVYLKNKLLGVVVALK